MKLDFHCEAQMSADGLSAGLIRVHPGTYKQIGGKIT